MQHPISTSTTGRFSRDNFRATARVIGIVYLAGMVVGIGGNILIQSIISGPNPLPAIAANGMLLALGVVFWLSTVAGDAAHGILMFPVLKRHSETMAVGYLGSRLIDATFIAVMALLILIQIPIGTAYLAAGTADVSSLEVLTLVVHQAELYAYELAMSTLGVSGLILNAVFYRTRLVPRPLAIWGLVGYAIFLVGSLMQILGFDLNSFQAIPGGVWEGFIGVWLIVKGFNPAASIFTGPTQAPAGPIAAAPEVAAATV